MPDDGLYFKPKHVAGSVTKYRQRYCCYCQSCLSRISRQTYAHFV